MPTDRSIPGTVRANVAPRSHRTHAVIRFLTGFDRPYDAGRLRADMMGGMNAALVTVADSIPFGLMAFAALGVGFEAQAPLTGLMCAIFGGLIAALFGGTPGLMSGPRAPTVVIFATMVATLAAAPDLDQHGGAVMAATLAFAGLACAGAIEAVLGLMRFGRMIKFVPYPVIAGFMNGVAVLLLLSQVKVLFGVSTETPWTDIANTLGPLHGWTLLVALVTVAGIKLGPRLTRLVPAPMVGLALGLVAYYGIASVYGLDVLGPVIGELPPAVVTPTALLPLASVDVRWIVDRMIEIAPTILILALVASVDSLMGAAAFDAVTNRRHQSNRELVGQGLGNITSAIFGGLAASSAFTRSAMSYSIGARTRVAGVSQSVILLLIVLAAGPWIGVIPRVALAAILVMNAFSMIDTWSGELFSRLRVAGGYRREILTNLGVVLIVAATTVAADLITAVMVGVLVSMILFVTQMSKSIVRKVVDGTQRHSLKVRERTDMELLAAYGKDIMIIELDGPLFFGTADALLTEAQSRAANVRYLIIDCRRVSEMDATGVRLLLALARGTAAHGNALLLSHLTFDNDQGRFVRAIGGDQLFSLARHFTDTDAALEWAEDRIVEAHADKSVFAGEMQLADLCLAEGLWPEDVVILEKYLTRREFAGGDVLFLEGDAGSALYLLVKGTVTIRLRTLQGGTVRLSTLIPGVMFGEMALLEGQPRSADAIATTDIVAYELDDRAFTLIMSDHPKLAARLMTNMAREIAARLRVTSDQLRAIN